jgi:ABC-type Fe3+/spermidine/putrescine transport system ATPase subunit
MSALSLSNITKSFGSTRVISNISLSISTGEFFSILGPSGCGKSTLLRIIAGLENADSGDITINDLPIDKTPPHKRGIGMVFQNYALWPHLTVSENVRFGLENQPLSNHERDQRLKEALDRVQMYEYRHRYPDQISGGQQQRTALARALAMNPAIILLDEPLSNLDAKLRHEIRAELRQLHGELETTMVYVTHDQEDALSLSNRLAIVNRGAIEQVGTPEEVYQDPITIFSAKFLGDANLLPCRVCANTSAEGFLTLESLSYDNKPPLPLTWIAKKRARTSITDGTLGFLCVRPSDLAITVADEACGENSVRAKIRSLTYLGAHYDVEFETSGGALFHALVNSTERHELGLKRELTVTASWRAARCGFIENPGTL